MKLLTPGLLIVPAMMLFGSLQAQNADEIIHKAADAIGGQDVISKITSIYRESALSVAGNESTDTEWVLIGKGFKSVSSFNGQELVQCYTDQGGWEINPFGGSADPTVMPTDQYNQGKSRIYAVSPIFNYSSNGGKVDLQGTEMVGSDNAYKILYTDPDSIQSTFYIDTSTYYILKMEATVTMQGNPTQISIAYSNYKKTDSGLVIPYQSDADYGQFQLSYTLSKVVFNQPIDPSVFVMPK